jgi:hypothetical protein
MGVWKGEPSGRDESTWAIAWARRLNASQSISTGVGRGRFTTGLPPLVLVARSSSTCVAVADAAAIVVRWSVWGARGLLWSGQWQWQECWGGGRKGTGGDERLSVGTVVYMGAGAGVGKRQQSQEWRRIIVRGAKASRPVRKQAMGRTVRAPLASLARWEKTA